MTLLDVAPTTPLPATLDDLADLAFTFATASKAPATIRAYRSDWQHFSTWCEAHGLVALPAEPSTVALYLTDMAATAKVATLTRRLSSISQAHRTAGHESPTGAQLVRTTMAGIRRTLGTAQTAKAPILTADLRAFTAGLAPDRVIDVRDRALLLLGFAGAFRRSELVALDIDDVLDGPDGLTVTIRRSKTDQAGAGRKVGIPYGSNPDTCPVRALRAWLAAAEITAGPVFRAVDRHGNVAGARLSGEAVALVVKRHAGRLGLPIGAYAGHSLRAGLATAAAQAGASERSIMNQTGHRSLPVVRRYIRDGSLFRDNAAAVVGL